MTETKGMRSSGSVRGAKQQQGSASEELPRLQSIDLPGSKLTGRLMLQRERQGPRSEGWTSGRRRGGAQSGERQGRARTELPACH